MISKQICLICKSDDCKIGYDLDVCNNYQFCDCPQCGKYIFGGDKFRNTNYFPYFGKEKNDNCILSTNKLKSYMFYHKYDGYILLGDRKIFDEYAERKFKYAVKNVTKEEIENWYPKTFAEKIDEILLKFAQKSKYFGDAVQYDFKDLFPMLFMENVYRRDVEEDSDENFDAECEFEFLLDYFIKNDYIVGYPPNIDLWQVVERMYERPNKDEELDLPTFTLSAKAWNRVYELQKYQANNKNVFVAMSFHESAIDIRGAIKQGIDNAEYSSILMDEIVHNHQIVPEMLRLIKESRFMIMDITQPNFGAYYEAGYAQGLGKEVIITCSQEVWDKKDFTCDKDTNCIYKQISTKPHFDIAQKQVLKWKDYADLTKQLTEWIKHLIG